MGHVIHEFPLVVAPPPPRPLFQDIMIASGLKPGCFIPTAYRSALNLAMHYGYSDHEDLAADLPDDANVIDIGASASTFGLEICRLRPDIRWVNADICYGKEDVQKQLAKRQDLPPNLELAAVNALELPEHFGEQGFQRVFSYYMVPHIEVIDGAAGLKAVENMLRMADRGQGRISTGPTRGRWSSFNVGGALTVEAPASESELQRLAPHLLDKVRMRAYSRFLHKSAHCS